MKVPLPTETELQSLPRAAMTVLVAQCLRRFEPIIPAISCAPVDATFRQAIEVVESYANGHEVSEQHCVELAQKLTDLWNSAYEYTLSSDPEYHLKRALEAAEFGVCIPF